MHTVEQEKFGGHIKWDVILYHAKGCHTVARFTEADTALLFCRYLNGGTIESWPYPLDLESEV